jgi:copper chaperone
VTTLDYDVRGMTCEHCVLSVREEVDQVPGVAGAAVDLASGRLTVIGKAIDDEAIRAAVAEAGYEAVSA